MFIGQFFKGNPNFVVLEMLEAILKVLVHCENNILMNYDIEWFIFTTLHMKSVFRLVSQGQLKFQGHGRESGYICLQPLMRPTPL